MKFPIIKEDEYRNFHSLFDHYKLKYPDFLSVMAINLDEDQKKKLNEILHTKTYVTKDQVKQRIILKVKGN